MADTINREAVKPCNPIHQHEVDRGAGPEPEVADSIHARQQALEERVNGRFNHHDFASHARASAENTGCHFLFEFPAKLVDPAADKAAAILCPDENGHHVLFMAYEEDNRRIRILEASEAPGKLVDFAFSFARVVSYLPFNDKLAVN